MQRFIKRSMAENEVMNYSSSSICQDWCSADQHKWRCLQMISRKVPYVWFAISHFDLVHSSTMYVKNHFRKALILQKKVKEENQQCCVAKYQRYISMPKHGWSLSVKIDVCALQTHRHIYGVKVFDVWTWMPIEYHWFTDWWVSYGSLLLDTLLVSISSEHWLC